MSSASMTATVHLGRAYRLITAATDRIGDLIRQMERYEQILENDEEEPFWQSTVHTLKGASAVESERSAIESDLRLAEDELTAADALDPLASIPSDDGYTTTAHFLRAWLYRTRGIAQYIKGSKPYAQQCLEYSVQLVDTDVAEFWLGLMAEQRGDMGRALQHHRRCTELDPTGEQGVEALRKADQIQQRLQSKTGCLVLLVGAASIATAGISLV